MNRFRKPLLFLSDSALFLCAVGFYLIAVRYMPYTMVGGGNLTMDLPLLYGCIALSQLLFKTYDSLWRYAESKEYLTLIAAALVGFGLYEFLARMLRWSTMSFVLLSAIAGNAVSPVSLPGEPQPGLPPERGRGCPRGHHRRRRGGGAAFG